MGKITVETCHIEGLKVITPAVFGDERGYWKHITTTITKQPESIWNSYRITSPVPVKAYFVDFISRSTIHRINLFV